MLSFLWPALFAFGPCIGEEIKLGLVQCMSFNKRCVCVFCSPLGLFQASAKFAGGSKGIMDAVVAATRAGAVSIIGKLSPKHILDHLQYSPD